MEVLANIGVAIVALLHLWIFIMESFFWKTIGRKAFKITPEFANQTSHFAINQGVYNLFLSAGLFWGLLTGNPVEAFHLKIFFLGCVVIAGIVGAATIARKILFIQALPAAITLVLLFFMTV